jgi:hypothetical protein
MKLLLLVLLPLYALAEAPRSPEAAFDHLVEVTNLSDAVDKTNELQLEAMVTQNPDMKAIEPDLRRFFADNISWKAISPDIRRIYLAEFTPGEIDDIATFYGTPTGRKAMQKMPAMMVKAQQVAMNIITTKMPAFMESVKHKLPKAGAKKK